MSLIRALLLLIFGWVFGVFSVGFISSLSFPYSEFPLIPITFALSLVFRMRSSVFWFLLTMVAVTDLYRTAGFGVGILSFVVLVMIGFRIASGLFTHRSLAGCIVISVTMGCMWALCIGLFGYAALWLHNIPIQISLTSLVISIGIQGCFTGIVVGILYILLPQWVSGRSTRIINERFV